jgi:hypothetical protein
MAATAASKLYPAKLHHTFTVTGGMVDVDAIKTAIATAITAQTYTGAALNGALVGTNWRLPRGVSVTTSAVASCYNTTDAIVFTGTDWFGAAATANVTLTQAGGGETIVATTAGLMSVTQIDVPAQLLATGQFEFGMRDIILTQRNAAGHYCLIGRQIRHGTAGDILVGYDGDTNPADPSVADPYRDILVGIEGERHDCFVTRIYGHALTTSTSLSVYV